MAESDIVNTQDSDAIGVVVQRPCSALDRQSLDEVIEHVEKLLRNAESWVERNTREGHSDAAESWKPKAEQYRRWISTLRSMPNDQAVQPRERK